MAFDIDTLYGKVIRRVNKYMGTVKLPGPSNIEKLRKLEHIRIKQYDKAFAQELNSIVRRFPDLESLHPFHRAMLEAYMPIDSLKRKLGQISALTRVLAAIRDDALFQITQAKSRGQLLRIRRAYLGRVWDVLEKNRGVFREVGKMYRALRRLPKIRRDEQTIVLAGFPNVGKSTLLRALTGSEPEIAPYPFTTKEIRIGHFEHHFKRFQVIDTPGLLDRPVEEMKPEEKKAIAALRELADVVVFIFDPLQDLQEQRDLLTKVRDLIRAPVLVVVNKLDAAPQAARQLADELGALPISALTGEGVERLRAEILKTLGWYHGE